MNLFNRVLCVSLILALSSQTVLASVASAEIASGTSVAAPAVATAVAKPSFAERRFFRRFDRKFNQFRKDISDMMDDSSDMELEQEYKDMITWMDEHGNYDMADAMSKDYSTSRGEMIRTRLVNMTSDEAKLLAENSLHEQIALAGGFKAFHARANAQRKKNLNTLCEAGKIASWTLIAPSMVFGMMTGSAAIMAIFGGVFTPVVAAWIGTTVGLEGFATPWFLDEMLTGCYKNRN